jgi:hypothetical protein
VEVEHRDAEAHRFAVEGEEGVLDVRLAKAGQQVQGGRRGRGGRVRSALGRGAVIGIIF